MDIIADSSESYSSPWGKIFQDIYKKNYLNCN